MFWPCSACLVRKLTLDKTFDLYPNLWITVWEPAQKKLSVTFYNQPSLKKAQPVAPQCPSASSELPRPAPLFGVDDLVSPLLAFLQRFDKPLLFPGIWSIHAFGDWVIPKQFVIYRQEDSCESNQFVDSSMGICKRKIVSSIFTFIASILSMI